MFIQCLVSFSGAHGAFSQGHEYEVTDEVGRSYIKCGFVVEVVKDPPVVPPRKKKTMKKDRAFNLEDVN